MKKEIRNNHEYLLRELEIFRTCYQSLKNGNDYDKLMAQKIKEEIEFIEKELNPFTSGNNK